MKDNKEVLEDLYKGEFSAVETYKQVLDKIGDEEGAAELMKMKKQHMHAVNTIRDHVNHANVEKPDGSGAWGAFAKFTMGTAKIFGDKAALKALKEGEEHGLKGYENALSKEIDESLKLHIKNTFIPNQKVHIAHINTMMNNI